MNLYGEHSNHPGHNASDCPLRRTVTCQLGSSSQNGYGCYYTGGHCVPSDKCKGRAEEVDRENEIRAMTEVSMADRHGGELGFFIEDGF